MKKQTKQRNIIFIPGIATTKWMVNTIETEMLKKFPNDKVYILREFYFYTQKAKLNEIINDVEDIVANGLDTILIGHSFGGIIAISAYFKSLKKGRKNIKKIITIASPHSIEVFQLKEIKEYLEYKNTELNDVEIKTFGGFLDSVVLNKYAKIMFKDHKTFFCGHNAFLFNKRIIDKILKEV